MSTDGESYTLFMKYKAENKEGLLRKHLLSMIKFFSTAGRLKFSSEEKMVAWTDKRFHQYDFDGDKSLSYEEFFALFVDWLDESNFMGRSDDKNMTQLEKIFTDFDVDHNLGLTKREVVDLLKGQIPAGCPKPEDKRIEVIADEVIAKLDLNGDDKLSFDEFLKAYQTLMERLRELIAEQRVMVMRTSGFRGIAKLGERDALLEKATGRWDRGVWLVCRSEVVETCARARSAGKLPLFLGIKESFGFGAEEDIATNVLGNMKMAKLLKIQELILTHREGNPTEQVCARVREAVQGCMAEGKRLVVGLASSAPDMMIAWNAPALLPTSWLDPQLHEPGPIAAGSELSWATRGASAVRDVAEGFEVVLTSGFCESNFREYLHGKLPLHWMQPIQVLPELEHVVQVFEHGLPEDETDAAQSEMDRLADML